MVSSVLSLGSLSLWLATLAAAQQRVQFNQVININGDMQLNQLQFPDGSKIETFSQSQQQLIANLNPNPLGAGNVVGSTGQPFIPLSRNSLNIQTNRAVDLVGGQIEMAIDPALLAAAQIKPENTFVAMLSSDRQAWIVQEDIKSVNTTDNTVRMVKLNKIDGEFMVVGRRTAESSVVLTQFGSAAANQVKIEGGGIQEVEFADGFRLSIRSSQPMVLATDVVNGVSANQLVGGVQPINNFRYLVQTNLGGLTPDLNNMVAVVQMPLNPERLLAMAGQMGIQANGGIAVGIAQRGIQLQPNVAGNFGRIGRRQARDGNGNQNNNNGDRNNNNGDRNNNNGGQNNNNGGQGQNLNLANQLLLNPTFAQVNQQPQLDARNMRIAVPVGSLDGEFIVTVSPAGGAAAAPVVQQPAVPAAPVASAPAASAPAAAPAASAPAASAPAASAPAAGAPATAPTPARMGTIGADGSAPKLGLSTMPMADVGKVPTAPGYNAKRQEVGPSSTNTITISMADLTAMAARQKSGTSGSAPLAVWSLMTSFAQSGGAQRFQGFPSAPAPALAQSLQRRDGVVGKRFEA
ncbi:hypothetical protein RB594_006929 [Gaeumannomyces avenae]